MSSGQKDTRERILETTWHLLESRRGQGIRLEDIAQAAGVSRQAVYLHFGSRTELFIATARYVDEVLRLPERIKQACEADDCVVGIDAYVAFWGNYIPEIYQPAKALLAMRDTDEGAAAAWADRMQALYEGCVYLAQLAARDGLLAPAWTIETAAQFFWAMLAIEVWELLTIERGWSNAQYIERMQQMIKRALLNTESATESEQRS